MTAELIDIDTARNLARHWKTRGNHWRDRARKAEAAVNRVLDLVDLWEMEAVEQEDLNIVTMIRSAIHPVNGSGEGD